jgi:hypothetical protein
MEHTKNQKNIVIVVKDIVVMSFNLVIYSGIALIILGAILYGVSCFMIKRIEKRKREINRYIFEIVRPKPKGKK